VGKVLRITLPMCVTCVYMVRREHSPNMASRDEDLSMTCKPAVLEHSLTEAATEFPPSGLGQVTSRPLQLSSH
jgi:hypothetical protein